MSLSMPQKQSSGTTISEETLSLELMPQTKAAVELVMKWRNDPHSLANSFDSRPKQLPAFYEEVKSKYFADSTLPCLFVLHEGQRVAFLRFRRLNELVDKQRACDISVNVAPEYRGKGLAAAAINCCMQIVRNANIDVVVADIKPENQASIKTFEKANFRFLAEIDYKVLHSGQNERVKRFYRTTVESAQVGQTSRKIGPGNPCYIIAEAGSNWRVGSPSRDIKMGKALIDVAAEAGADAVKFQTYQPATTYVANAGQSDYLSESGIDESITDIFADLAMPHEMLPELASYAKNQNIAFMSSPFSKVDFEAVDPFVDIHKIASYEISHLRLIEAIANSQKIAVLSTGASNIEDIEWAVRYFQSLSKATLCLMQCTAKYPANLSGLNLGTIPVLRSRFGLPVGLSDHTRDPLTGPMSAVALGANLIEKHYTLDNRLPGPDHAFAIDAKELKQMVEYIRKAEEVFGTGTKDVQREEEELYAYARRGLQAIKNIAPGEIFIEGINFDILRPGKRSKGIHSKHLVDVQNAVALKKLNSGDGISFDHFKKSE